MNKLLIIGRLTKDIELKEYGDLKVVNNTIAVYMGKDKDKNDITNFFDFKAFGYGADKLSSQAQKGSKIAIEGALKQETWESDGATKSKVMIYADNIEIMESTKKETKEEADVDNSLPF